MARPGDAVLFKGSRGVHVERALERFQRTADSSPMLYFILLYEQLYRHVSPFRVFRYTTFRTAFASLTALFLCIALGPWLIDKLREFQIGQYIREEGPKSHQKKAGTPTMGGVLIIISIVVPTLLWADLRISLRVDRHRRAAGLSAGSASWTITPRSPSGATSGSRGRRKLVYQFAAGASSWPPSCW